MANKSIKQRSNPVSTNSYSSGVKPSKSVESTAKKPFDKKKWRTQKYSLKQKIQNWEDKRKKTILRHYYKDAQKDNNAKRLDVQKIYAEDEEEQETVVKTTENVNKNVNDHSYKPHKKAHLEFLRIKEEKQKQREEFLKLKKEREEARKEQKKKKIERFKKLNKKTRKGQPIMKERLEDLLEKIQKSVSST